MEKFDEKQADKTADKNAINVVDIAIARMKTDAVVKEERKQRFKYVLFAAIGIAALAGFSKLDFVFQKPASETAANGDITITLKQGLNGHYKATGMINGVSVKFLVDTGASVISIPMSVAKKLDLQLGVKRPTITANGNGTAYETSVKSVELGGIKFNNVESLVTEGLDGDVALLGMSFLRRTKIVQEKGIMTITY